MARVEEKKNRKNESCLNFAHKFKFYSTFSMGTPELHTFGKDDPVVVTDSYACGTTTVEFASTLRSQDNSRPLIGGRPVGEEVQPATPEMIASSYENLIQIAKIKLIRTSSTGRSEDRTNR
jgi:hypothetical protein